MKINIKRDTLLLLLTLITSILSVTSPVKADKDISNPSNYYKWTQTNTDQPWVKAWGGANNQGCFAVAIAVQGARAGFVKTGDGKQWNPLNLASGSDGSAPDRAYGLDKKSKKYLFSPRKNVGNYSMGKLKSSGGNYQETAKGMGAAKARKGIKAIYDAGYYPIVHLSGGAGYPAKTHWLAVNKVSGNKITYYDPGRTKTSDTAKALKIKHKTLLGCTAWVNGYGNGPRKIQDAPSEPASDFNSQDNGSNKGNDKSSDSSDKSSGDGMTAARIKPTFNPFTTPTANNNSIGYDTEEKNGPIDRSTRLTFYEYLGPKLVSWVQVAAIAFMLIFLGWTIVTTLIALADFQMGGLLSKASQEASNGKLNKLVFPYGNIRSIQLVKRTFLIMFLIVLICGLVLTDTLPLILGQFFSWLAYLI